MNCTGGSVSLINCVIRANSSSYFAGGIYCEWSSPVLTNCVIASNTSYQYGGAAIVTLNSSPVLTHCTIVGNSGGQGNALRFLNDSHPRIANSILWNPGTEVYADGMEISYSCVQGGWEGKGNVDSPPDLVDPSGGDYHLLDGSPCVGRATTTAGLATDIEGNPRVLGAVPDMGAYEAPASFSQGELGYDPTRYYVKADAGQEGDGRSWEHAFKSITAALWSAWPGDEVWVAGGRYNEGVVLESGVSVYGGFAGSESSLSERNWKANPTTIDASGLSRQAVFGADAAVLDGFRVTGGTASGVYSPRSSVRLANCAIQENRSSSPYGGGGITTESASLEVVACTIANNTSLWLAGGVYCMNCSAAISGCTIADNNGPGSGGGIYSYGSVLAVTSCRISNNSSGTANGGVGYVDSGSGGGGIHGRYSTLSLTGCSFTGNYSSMEGGGLNCYKSDADIEDCTFSDNLARHGGGGVNLMESTCSLSDCVFDGNTVSTGIYSGGGFLASSATVQIHGSVFSRNVRDGADFVACTADVRGCTFSGNSGNGVYCYNSPGPTLSHCVISNTSGRGLYCRKCPAVVSSCTLTDNINPSASSPTSSGGAVYCEGLPSLTLQDSLLSGNSAVHGGGVYSNGSSPMLLSCRLLKNTASQRGGGLYCESTSGSAVRNCVVCDNTAREGGGLYCSPSSAPVLLNCTISGNRATGGTSYAGGIHNLGTALSLRNCILWNDLPKEMYRTITTGDPVQHSNIQGGYPGTSNIDEDPLFVNPMLGDFHLQAESPCLGAGIGPALDTLVPLQDIDGDPRVGASCDMGADEVPDPTWIREWLNY